MSNCCLPARRPVSHGHSPSWCQQLSCRLACWYLLSSLLLVIASAQVRGSFDDCEETSINWTEVHTTITTFIADGTADHNFDWVRELAIRGPPESRESDCWYGWISLRFFLVLILPKEQISVFLQDSSQELINAVWLGSPWLQLLGSRWNIPAVIHSASSVVRDDPVYAGLVHAASCSKVEQDFLEKVRASYLADDKESVQDVEVSSTLGAPAAAVLHANTGSAVRAPCSIHATITAVLTLGLLSPFLFHITPGYALRYAQESLVRGGGSMSLLASPWPVSLLLARLSKHLWQQKGSWSGAAAEDELAEAVVASSREEFPSIPPSFLPPITRRERLRLLEALQAVHTALGLARIAYLAMTGTILGAMRHHGFVPWDGDADVCIDIQDEPRLLQVALLQSAPGSDLDIAEAPEELRAAARFLYDSGFELYAHADRPLTFKVSGRHVPRVPGRPYGYPYVDLWFCHGWAEGPFLMQSAQFGVPIPRQFLFPRRKVFFAGILLWTFADPLGALSAYYNDKWFHECVGHNAFHRQERKYSEENELHRYDGRLPCSELSEHFSFASAAVPGIPSLIISASGLAERLQAWLQAVGEVSWWPVIGDPGTESAAHLVPDAIRYREGPLMLNSIVNISTSSLNGPQGRLLHHLSDVSASLARQITCKFILRFLPLREEGLDTQLVGPSGLSPGSALGALPSPMIEGKDDGRLWRLEVLSCVCRRSLRNLNLEWVMEGP